MAAGIGAWLLGWRELVFVAVGAAVLLITGIPWVTRGRGVRISVRTSAARVAVGDAASAIIEAERQGRAPLPNAVEVPIGDEVRLVPLPRLRRGQAYSVAMPIPTQVRGPVTVGPARIAHADPFGALERLTVLSDPVEVNVHPRITRIPATSAGLIKDLEGEAGTDLTADDVAFHSLREYQPGDDRRLVHWRSSAKHNNLLVRQFEPSRRDDTIICFSSHPGEVDADNYELVLSLVGTIGLAVMEERRILRIYSGHRKFQPSADQARVRSRARLLDDLTRMQQRSDAGIVATAKSIVRLREAALVWLIVGAETSSYAIRAALAALPVEASPMIVRASSGAPPTVSRLGSFPVLTVGVLEDIARELGHGVSR